MNDGDYRLLYFGNELPSRLVQSIGRSAAVKIVIRRR